MQVPAGAAEDAARNGNTAVSVAVPHVDAAGDGLTARLEAFPAWHGGMPFWVDLHFSEEPRLSYRKLRDELFAVTGGRILRGRRIEKGSNLGWRLQVAPEGFGAISLTLPATQSCDAEAAVCTAEGLRLGTKVAVTVPGPGERLAARMDGLPATHAGVPFTGELHFNHAPSLDEARVRDNVFVVTGGRIASASPLASGSTVGWRLHIEPEGGGDVRLTLPSTVSCDAPGAVCTAGGRKLESGFGVTLKGPGGSAAPAAPAAFSVADAEVREGPGAVLAFEVSLSRALETEARVGVATRDVTATAGEDYTAVSAILTFAPGETSKTVEVPVLDDAHDEDEETVELVLSDAAGRDCRRRGGDGDHRERRPDPEGVARAVRPHGDGASARCGRGASRRPAQAGMRATLAGQALRAASGSGRSGGGGDAAARPAAGSELGGRAAQASHGRRVAGAGWSRYGGDTGVGGPEPEREEVTRHAFVTGTGFTLTRGSAEDGGFASLWGRGAVSRFDGREDGLTLDGEVTTGFLGADFAAEGWTAGLALGHSVGTGGYRRGDCAASGAQAGGCGGRIETELTGL